MASVMSWLRAPFVLQGLGILALFNLAVAHPVYEVLAGSPDFFVARRAEAADVWLLAALLSFVLPAGIVALVWIVGRISTRAGMAALALAVGVLSAAMALQVLKTLGVEQAMPAFSGAALAGIVLAVCYVRIAAARVLVALLGPALLAAPLLFLARPSVRVFTSARAGPPAEYPTTPLKATPPIVLIVFDQLPLVSLLDADGLIDRRLYPAFAGLADEATWFRNATTISETTGWALPPIVTGMHPRPNAPPMAAAHRDSLFTFLSGSYRMNVVEPITALCPKSVCPPERDGLPRRLAAMGIDLAVVYLHVLAPRELEAALPPVSQNWKNFAAGRRWQQRWVQQRDADRRAGPNRFIEAIESNGDRPTLHFLHALLPHEPYIYARTGQAFDSGSSMAGLGPGARWGTDEWLVAQNYQAHLVQLGYVDALLGRIVDRLKTAGLYDSALIVVTSDHGASFRPGQPFKGLNEQTAADIMAVPLLVKAPGQRAGVISDRNVETLDVAPTIAGVLGTTLPWNTDGAAALNGATPARAGKAAFISGGRSVFRRPASLVDQVRASVARKLTLFRDGDPLAPLGAPHPDLLGRDVAELRVGERWGQPVLLNDAVSFNTLDPTADFVPARLVGEARGPERAQERLALAVAVNNRVRATTLTSEGSDSWSAFVPLDAFRPGRNDVQIFVVREEADGRVLHAALETRRPPDLDLISGEARHMWGVRQSGLHPREFRGTRPFYWTNGAARLVTTLDPEALPTALEIDVAMTGGRALELRVLVDGCELFRGRISGAWSKTLSLDRCPLDGDEATFELLSETFSPGPQDSRRLGIALDSVTLVSGSSQ